MESKSLLSGLPPSRTTAEATQTMRLEPTPSQLSLTNGYSNESVIHDRQGLAGAVHGDEKDVACSTTLDKDLVVTIKRTESIPPLPGVNSNNTRVVDAMDSDVLCCPIEVLRNGSSSELDVNNLCHFSDSSGYSSERDSVPLFSVSETVPTLVTYNAALCPDLRNGLSSSSSLQLSTSDLDDSVCQVVGSVCCKAGVATRATSAPVAGGCGDTIVGVTSGALVASGCGDTIVGVTSGALVASGCGDTIVGVTSGAHVASGCSDMAARAMSVQVPSSISDAVVSATTAPVVGKHVDCIASIAKPSPAGKPSDTVESGSTATSVMRESDSSCLRETLNQTDKCVSGRSGEKRKSTGDVEGVRARSSPNSKQRYSDIPAMDHSDDILPGTLDRTTHGSLQLHQQMQSPKQPICDEKTRAEGVLSTVPTLAVSAASRSELAPERTLQEDPLLKKRYDRRSVTSISSDSRVEMRQDLPPQISPGCIVMSQSTEKITGRNNGARVVQFFPGGGIVRSSRSQENYFDSGDITCVDIDLDDNIASSVDALHYDTSSMASLDSMGVPDWTIDGSESDLFMQANDEKCFKSSEPDCASLPAQTTDTHSSGAQSGLSESASLQAKSSLMGQSKTRGATALTSRSEDSRPPAGHGIALSINSQEVEAAFGPQNRCSTDDVQPGIPALSTDEPKPSAGGALRSAAAAQTLPSGGAQRDPTDVSMRESSSTDEDDDDDEEVARSDDLEFLLRDESIFRQPTKDVDRPSAARLAKRLFYLHGFKKSDVSRHLSKKNSFSQLVGEEYLKYFDFSGEALDSALRRFMKHMTIYGETQDRERLLAHFSCRYQQCNSDIFKSEDCCHTLACALLLLNQDLNGLNIGRKITLPEFISNLADMNDGEQFSKELLKSFYQSIKNQPLEFEAEELHEVGGGGGPMVGATATAQAAAQPRFVSYNPFYEIPDPSNAVEFKKGYVMRKCCLEPDGRKTPLGKRGWKMFYATLRDMVLHLHIDEHGFKRNQHYTNANNAIHIHHSLGTKATDYQKKNHVFRLQTADLAQYLIQTSDSKECQEWIDAINFVAASYSAPSPISSIASQKRFQRPLLPSTYTRLNLREQINHHEKMIAEFDRELLEHRKNPPEKGAKTRLIQDYCKKENYLKFELKRYKTYCRLLQYKMSTFPELEPSLAEIAIGEVDELGLSSSPVESPFDSHGPTFFQSQSADSQSYASDTPGLNF